MSVPLLDSVFVSVTVWLLGLFPTLVVVVYVQLTLPPSLLHVPPVSMQYCSDGDIASAGVVGIAIDATDTNDAATNESDPVPRVMTFMITSVSY